MTQRLLQFEVDAEFLRAGDLDHEELLDLDQEGGVIRFAGASTSTGSAWNLRQRPGQRHIYRFEPLVDSFGRSGDCPMRPYFLSFRYSVAEPIRSCSAVRVWFPPFSSSTARM